MQGATKQSTWKVKVKGAVKHAETYKKAYENKVQGMAVHTARHIPRLGDTHGKVHKAKQGNL